MEWSAEQTTWLVKVFQPEVTVASLPGRAVLPEATRAALLGLAPDAYAAELARSLQGAKEAARELLAEPEVGPLVDSLPLRRGARVVALGDSRTSDPQSWAVILGELLALRRPSDELSLINCSVAGDTTTHGLIRMGEVIAQEPDWVLFFLGLNDARTQGPNPTKTLVHHEETARNLHALCKRSSAETKARCLWITPPAVNSERVSKHWALSRFGVGFRREDVARVAEAIKGLGGATVDLHAALGEPPAAELLNPDGVHFTLAGQKRVALEVLRGWSALC